MSQEKVAIVRCPDYSSESVHQALTTLLSLLDVKLAKEGEKIVIKPNILSPAKPEKAITTHPEIIGALVRLVRAQGGHPFVGDSPNLGGIHFTLRHTGIKEATEQNGGSILSFDRPQKLKDFPFFALDRQVLTADGLMNVAKLKAHSQLLITGCVKNLFGIVPGRRKPLLHMLLGGEEEKFARMLLRINEILKPRLNLADAVIAMEGNGPKGGTPKKLGLLFGGKDAVAVDRVIAEVLSVPLEEHFVLRTAQKLGIRTAFLEKLEVVGVPIEEVKCRDFKLPRLVPINFSPLRVLKGNIKHLFLEARSRA